MSLLNTEEVAVQRAPTTLCLECHEGQKVHLESPKVQPAMQYA